MKKWMIILVPGAAAIEVEADEIRRSSDGKCWTIKSNGGVVGELSVDVAFGYFETSLLTKLDNDID